MELCIDIWRGVTWRNVWSAFQDKALLEDEQKYSVGEFVDGPYNKLLTVNISATVALYNEFHACFRC
jgi:hypothetical protein